MKKKWVGVVIVVAALIAGGLWLARDEIEQRFFEPTKSNLPTGVSKVAEGPDVEVLATGLAVPWSVAVLPSGDLLVTERTGLLTQIGKSKSSLKIESVQSSGEGGLLGLVLHPNFEKNNRLYLYLTSKQGDQNTCRIESYTYKDNKLSDKKVILSGIPGADYHDGGRMAFGPDGYLYVTTGDATKPDLAQDKSSLAGKILRLTSEGQPAPGNPFGTAIYSYGHRNPQGIAWDSEGRLWSTEHGRSGPGTTGYDELNLIKPGANYGWPLIQGDEQREGMVKPVAHSGPDETWAPASLSYSKGSLFFAGLRGQTLYQAKIKDDSKVDLVAHFKEQYGRLREAYITGNFIYITTSNTDGRADKKEGDDKLIKVKLSVFGL